MSGYSTFTWWIHTEAKTLLHKKEEKKIVDTFFTSSPIPNSDTFCIRLEDSTVIDDENTEDVDWMELQKRFNESKNNN